MCGTAVHGFWWIRNNEYQVAICRSVNSHERIKEMYDIPITAHRLGINIFNGEIISNGDEPIPQEVINKTQVFFECEFPNREEIAQHVRQHYGKNNDRGEWDRELSMLISGGYFSQAYCKSQIKYYESQIKHYESRIKHYESWIKDYESQIKNYESGIKRYESRIKNYESRIKHYESWIKDYESQIKHYESRIKRYKSQIKNYESWIKNCESWAKNLHANLKNKFLGTHDTLEINSFLKHFMSHPNEFWKYRTEKKENEPVEYVVF